MDSYLYCVSFLIENKRGVSVSFCSNQPSASGMFEL